MGWGCRECLLFLPTLRRFNVQTSARSLIRRIPLYRDHCSLTTDQDDSIRCGFLRRGEMSKGIRTRMVLALVGAALACAQAVVAQQEPDWSKVQIKVTKVSANIYMLEGQGGNIAASVGEDGIVIVDDQFAPLAG